MKHSYKELQGKNKVLLSASHAFPQVREGVYKPQDLFTDDLVEKICGDTGCWGLETTKAQNDPNWYTNSPFRLKLRKLVEDQSISLVLDIHGKKDDGKSIIDFYPNKIFENTECLKFEKTRTKHFKNNEQITIAEDLEGTEVACVQLEISRTGRTIGTKENELVVKYLLEIIGNVD